LAKSTVVMTDRQLFSASENSKRTLRQQPETNIQANAVLCTLFSSPVIVKHHISSLSGLKILENTMC